MLLLDTRGDLQRMFFQLGIVDSSISLFQLPNTMG